MIYGKFNSPIFSTFQFTLLNIGLLNFISCFLHFFTLGCLNITSHQCDIVYLPSSTGKCIHQNLYLYMYI